MAREKEARAKTLIVTLVDSMGSDLSVVNAARVSFSKESNKFSDKDEFVLIGIQFSFV